VAKRSYQNQSDPARRVSPFKFAADPPDLSARDRNLSRITNAAWKALLKANDPPEYYRYCDAPSWIEHDDLGGPVIKRITQDRMRYLLARVVNWYVERDGIEMPALPPEHVVKNMLATPNIRLPVLESVVQVPIFSARGNLNTNPGYDPSTRCCYAPTDGFCLPHVPDRPTTADLRSARLLLFDDLLVDFPLTGEAGRAHAACLFLLPYARRLISGPTPLHLIEKPSPGTGATLLAQALIYPSLGQEPSCMTEPGDESESRRCLLASLRSSPLFNFIDNVKRPLESAALTSAITSMHLEDRVVGTSEMIRVPVRCVWIATANNPIVSDEMARRIAPIRLDAAMEHPWLRDTNTFKHPKLIHWINENRAELVWAGLVLVQGWLAAGAPKGKAVLGMFESWSEVMGGICQVAEIPGFLGNLDEFYARTDQGSEGLKTFIRKWWVRHQGSEVGTSDLLSLATDLDLGDGTEKSQSIRLGRLLGSMRDRVIAGFRIVDTGTCQGSGRWKLEPEKEKGRSR
jgi:putative DNA primase/helicase